jgi:hypothetical protein
MRVAREVDDAPIGVAHIIRAPCLAAGCRTRDRLRAAACAGGLLNDTRIALDALLVVAVRSADATCVDSNGRTPPFAPRQNQEQGRLSPRSFDCARFLAVFSLFRAASIVAPWSDQDSVAERIAPLLLMLTRSV